MRGGSPAGRGSITVTPTPRQARSMASVRPTGPDPAINTALWFRAPVSWMARLMLFSVLRLQADEFRKCGQVDALFLDRGGKFGGRAAARDKADVGEGISYDRFGRGCAHIGCNALAALRWHVARPEEALQTVKRELRIAGFDSGWYLRNHRKPMSVTEREHSKLA